MGRTTIEEQTIRVLQKNNTGTYTVSIPINFVRSLRLQSGQKLELTMRGQQIIIKDWKNPKRK